MVPESIFVVLVVVAVTQLIKFVRAKDWDSVITIVSAAIVGAVAGLAEIDGLTVVTGLMAGLTASGLVTVAEKVRA
jgi:uncharacterized membrane protein